MACFFLDANALHLPTVIKILALFALHFACGSPLNLAQLCTCAVICLFRVKSYHSISKCHLEAAGLETHVLSVQIISDLICPGAP